MNQSRYKSSNPCELIKIEETQPSFTDDSTFLMHDTESEWDTTPKHKNTSVLSPEETKKMLGIPQLKLHLLQTKLGESAPAENA